MVKHEIFVQFDFVTDVPHNPTSCLPDMYCLFFTISLKQHLLAADYSSSPLFPLQDEKNQVLITNAWLQLVRLLLEHLLCDHSVIIAAKYIFGKCVSVSCLCPVGSAIHIFKMWHISTEYDFRM